MPKALEKKPVKRTPKASEQIVINKAVDLAVKEAVGDVLESIGTEKFTCNICCRLLRKDRFYKSTDPVVKSGITSVCKECATNIAVQKTLLGNEKGVTKQSLCDALERLDKPFLIDVYNSSIEESSNESLGKTKNNVWSSYIKNIAMQQYKLMRWKDSVFSNIDIKIKKLEPDDEATATLLLEYEQNKKDTIKLLSYDPFLKEAEDDKPFLYANLIGYLDSSEDANEDRMRLSSIIEIVKGFNHIERLNDIITALMNDVSNMAKNISTIKSLEDTKNKITSSLLNLAKDNGISLKHSVNSSKGENTWTGKIRKLKEMNLRDAEVNGFDIGTCKGMRQVADISHASIIKQIKLDENDYTEMLADQRDLIKKYQFEAENWSERARLLLRENLDLKSLLEQHGIVISNDLIRHELFESEVSADE